MSSGKPTEPAFYRTPQSGVGPPGRGGGPPGRGRGYYGRGRMGGRGPPSWGRGDYNTPPNRNWSDQPQQFSTNSARTGSTNQMAQLGYHQGGGSGSIGNNATFSGPNTSAPYDNDENRPYYYPDPAYEAEAEEVREWNALHRWGLMTRTIAHYERIMQIGEGTYGQVYKARCFDTNRMVAMKKIRLHHGEYWGMPPTVIREIKILKRLRHRNLVQLVEVVSSKGVEHLDEQDEWNRKSNKTNAAKENTTATTCTDIISNTHKSSNDRKIVDAREGYKGNIFLVLEYVSHDLTGLLDMKFNFTEVHVKCIFRQLLEALEYMHDHKYVHRDIKPSNILIDSHFNLKLADFGLARNIEPPILDNAKDRGGPQEFTNKVITLWYRPPELLLGATRYGEAVDLWSAGCVLAELLIGKPLLPGKSDMEQLKKIFDLMGTPTAESWEGFQDLKLLRTGRVTIDKPRTSRLRENLGRRGMETVALNLVEKLLELDPNKRLTASRALTARYFTVEPRAPANPAELGHIEGDFLELFTKKKRKQAKAKAEVAKEEAIRMGVGEKEAEKVFDQVYMEEINKPTTTGASSQGPTPDGVDFASKETRGGEGLEEAGAKRSFDGDEDDVEGRKKSRRDDGSKRARREDREERKRRHKEKERKESRRSEDRKRSRESERKSATAGVSKTREEDGDKKKEDKKEESRISKDDKIHQNGSEPTSSSIEYKDHSKKTDGPKNSEVPTAAQEKVGVDKEGEPAADIDKKNGHHRETDSGRDRRDEGRSRERSSERRSSERDRSPRRSRRDHDSRSRDKRSDRDRRERRREDRSEHKESAGDRHHHHRRHRDDRRSGDGHRRDRNRDRDRELSSRRERTRDHDRRMDDRPLDRERPPMHGERGPPGPLHGSRDFPRDGPPGWYPGGGPQRDGPPPRDRGGPPRERDWDGPPQGGDGPPRDWDGPPRDRDGPPRHRDGPPRDWDGPHRDHDGPPRHRDGPPRDWNGPPMDWDGPPRDWDGPPRDRDGPPRGSFPRGPPPGRDFPPERGGGGDGRRGPPPPGYRDNDGPPGGFRGDMPPSGGHRGERGGRDRPPQDRSRR